MSEIQLDFVPVDDGEPPSPKSNRENYQTGEVYEGSFSDYMAVVALTSNAESVIAAAGVLTGDMNHNADVSVARAGVTLRRRVVRESGRDEDGQSYEKNSELYFYTELSTDGTMFQQVWSSGGAGLGMLYEYKDTVTAAADMTDRLERAFSVDSPAQTKRRLGSVLLKRFILSAQHA
jgi:hypothetical protein